MSLTDYQRWRDRGSPFRLMTPAADLRDKLRAHGYTVYDIGNESHLTHEPPEDHTPYSRTAYPGASVYGVGYAEDVMPPAPGQRSKVDGLPLPTLQQLGAQLLADRKANVAGIRWLKYMNWEPQRDGGGDCWHESWQPTYARRSSTDRGHIHISGLTGYETSTVGAGYDPVTRIRGGDDMTPEDLLRADVLPDVPGNQYTVGGAIHTTLIRAGSIAEQVAEIRGDVDALVGKVAYLGAAVEQLAARPPATIDYDQLADAIFRRAVGAGQG